MTGFAGIQQQMTQQQQQTQTPQAPSPQQPQAPQAPTAQMQVPQLPATGLQQQLASLQAMRAQVGPGQAQNVQLQQQQPMASTSLNQLAQNLAQRYGLSLPRGPIVDPEGNFLVTPEQLAQASGGAETMGSAAAKMNYIAAAMTKRQNMQQMAKARAAAETGLGQVQQRGRGSLAALQSGLYSNLANLYASEQYEAADFSYYIQKEYLGMQQEILRRQEKLAKRKARGSFITGLGLTAAGIATGNIGLISAGASGVSQVGETGWF